MDNDILIRQLADIVRSGAPLILAATGETFTERAGVINLSLDGSLLLSALAGFAVAVASGNLIIGTLAAMAVGAAVALLVAFSSISLRRSQVAVGFILTLLCRDLAIFLGNNYRGARPVSAPFAPIPILSDLPVVGAILFRQDVYTYASFVAIIAAWLFIFRTRPGLSLRSVGERPETAFARGLPVRRLRYLYTALGGALVGVGGAAYSLNLTPTWTESAISGNGWIALAIVIFGGWHPVRVAIGVYLVAALRTVVTGLQSGTSQQGIELLNMLPWLLMLLTLFAVGSPSLSRVIDRLPARLQALARPLLRAKPPAALGAPFDGES